ncbi:hypothetical protein HMPREF1544_04493 [Mucor circinelloides 1006PhL]|uniref:Uncharacterized protein n=1 Tax=Mucor circinelloides f. circinelloides (strain 1006PhL) TaxID=1220926 RepID=S2K0P2_MUCC1|nr:hypothetical protein HMPREF1544_04493 [Mucor circinelloides 1006PhL]
MEGVPALRQLTEKNDFAVKIDLKDDAYVVLKKGVTPFSCRWIAGLIGKMTVMISAIRNALINTEEGFSTQSATTRVQLGE